jgi:hypothetical protein
MATAPQGTVGTLTQESSGSLHGLFVLPYGDQGIKFPQNVTGGALFVELQTANVAYDARKTDPGIANTLRGAGAVTAPAAGNTIATVALLINATYRVDFYLGLSGPAVLADTTNFQLFYGAASQGQFATPTSGFFPIKNYRFATTTADNLALKAATNGTAGVTYSATILATRTV